jgi:HAD superfamily phosphatase (TIGR01668 family)
VGRLERWFRPDRHYDRIASVDLDALRADGIRGLIVDLDNTLVPWRSAEIPDDVAAWAARAAASGFQLCIASNTRRYGRLSKVAEALGATYVTNVSKPRRGGFRRAAAQMGLDLNQVAVIGDQLLTDILAAKRLGVHAILVDRLAAREFIITKFNRLVENLIAKALARTGRAA